LRGEGEARPLMSKSSLASSIDRSARRRRALRALALTVWCGAAALLLQALVVGRPSPLVLHLLAVPVHIVVAYLVADLMSGLVHFAADTFGSRRTPILGPMFVAPFRDHHTDPLEITSHDLVDTNGNTAVPAMMPLLAMNLFPVQEAAWAWHLGVFTSALCAFGLLTNQVHKWAHSASPPALAAWAQSRNLILSPKRHAHHHEAPFESHYCITSGWTEPLMGWATGVARRRRLAAVGEGDAVSLPPPAARASARRPR
jgi:plasmanylethanolamine desaturase